MDPVLTREELHRYSRHLILPDVALEGQRRIKAARVLLVGAGGLGSPAALYLAAAGIGTIGLVNVNVETYETRLASENALEILGKYDVIVDGTDNFATRYLVNDACVLLGKPN